MIKNAWVFFVIAVTLAVIATGCGTTVPSTSRPIEPASANAAESRGVGVRFVSVIGGAPGGQATVTVQTDPRATCTIRYVTPDVTTSRALGLVPKTADASGRVTWEWTIGANESFGTGTVIVTCNGVTARAAIAIG